MESNESENPMAREDVASKARDLMSPILGKGAGAKLITEVLRLESLKNIRGLRPYLLLLANPGTRDAASDDHGSSLWTNVAPLQA